MIVAIDYDLLEQSIIANLTVAITNKLSEEDMEYRWAIQTVS